MRQLNKASKQTNLINNILCHTFALLILCIAPLAQSEASVQLSAGENNKIHLQIDNATNKEVILALVDKFNLEVRLRDPAWAKLRQTDTFEGSLEQVFKRLLNRGNYILAYDSQGNINGISILGEGEEVVFYAASKRPNNIPNGPSPSKDAIQQDQANTPKSTRPTSQPSMSASTQGSNNSQRSTSPPQASPNAGSSVTNMLANRAQQGASTAPLSDSEPSNIGTNPHQDQPALPNQAGLSAEQQAQLQKLTQQAQSDVQALVDALRQAEADSNQP